MADSPSVVVIGVGNELRHDDAAGLEVARRVRALAQARGAASAGMVVHEHEGEALGLIERWDGAAACVLVDAVHSGAPAGTLHRVDASAAPLPATLGACASTHLVGLAETIELARQLDRLPARVLVHGVEGARFDAGSGLSPQVRAAVRALAGIVLQDASRLASELRRC